MTPLDRYNQLVDELRDHRRRIGLKKPVTHVVDDRERFLLEQLEDTYIQLSDFDQERVNDQGWRSWPDLYDQRSR